MTKYNVSFSIDMDATGPRAHDVLWNALKELGDFDNLQIVKNQPVGTGEPLEVSPRLIEKYRENILENDKWRSNN